MFERFTDRARSVLVLAQEEARQLEHGFIGTEHILLGLLLERDGVGAQALTSVGISLEAVRERVRATIGSSGTPPDGSPPFTPRAKKVLELSLREALQLGHSYIGTEHLVLGLVREGQGLAATVLADLGAESGRVRQAVLEIISGGAPGTPGATWTQTEAHDVTDRDAALPGSGPLCPQCHRAVEEGARSRTMSVAPEDGAATEPIVVKVVYCGHCGVLLHMFRSEGQGPTRP